MILLFFGLEWSLYQSSKNPRPLVHAPVLLLLGQLLQCCPAARESFRDTELGFEQDRDKVSVY